MSAKITFAEPTDMGDGESETDVSFDGIVEASIYKHSKPAGRAIMGSISATGEYVAAEYEVQFFGDQPDDDRHFDVDDYPTGARGALAAAKKYTRSILNREES